MSAGRRIFVDRGATFTDGILSTKAYESWATISDRRPSDRKLAEEYVRGR